MTTVTKRSYFLEHDKGTKFYEVVSIWLEERNVGMLIRRWGKVMYSTKNYGAQVKKQHFTDYRTLVFAENDILGEKRKGNKDGKYSDASADFGIHGVASVVSATRTATASAVLAVEIVKHYGLNEGSDICAQLGSSVTGREESVVDEGVVAEIVSEPVRVGDWGSW